jgi:hypothetical protein
MEILATVLKFVFFWGVAFAIMKIGYDETLKGK